MSMTTSRKTRHGRKRLIIAGGAALGIGALLTAALFNDYGLLDLGGDNGFGGDGNTYNLQFSNQQETTVAAADAAGSWLEANPDAADIVIPGADALFPGGDPLYVNLPAKNVSPTLASTLQIAFEVTTDNPTAQDLAYAKLLRLQVIESSNAGGIAPVEWLFVPTLDFTTGDTTTPTALINLGAGTGTIVTVRVSLAGVGGAITQDDVNAANGGHATVQARFDGQAIDPSS